MSHNQTINETPIPFRYAVIPMLVMIIIMGICVIVLKASPHVPLLIGTATAAFIASRFGYTWNFIEEACYAGIKMALPAILIIIMIGLTIGSWIGGGIVATMVDSRTLHSREVLQRLQEAFGDLVFDTRIGRTIKFPDASVATEPIISYAPNHAGAHAYRRLAREVIARGDAA